MSSLASRYAQEIEDVIMSALLEGLLVVVAENPEEVLGNYICQNVTIYTCEHQHDRLQDTKLRSRGVFSLKREKVRIGFQNSEVHANRATPLAVVSPIMIQH